MVMTDLNFMFLPVGRYYRADVPTCDPGDCMLDAAVRMRDLNISAIVVCDAGTPVGIMTDRGLRDCVIAQNMNPHDVHVHSAMNAPPITISLEASLLDALQLMSRHSVQQLIVLNEYGQLAGTITESDIFNLQKQSPQHLAMEIERAATIDELRALHIRVQDLVAQLLETGVNIQAMVRLIAGLNDRVLLRLIHVVRDSRYVCLDNRFAFIVLGSQGRSEQTLTTDQDTAIIYADDLSAAEVSLLGEFCRKVIDSLVTIGIPYCPGDTMATNEFWRRSISGWRGEIDRWLSSINLENIINIAMFCDMRTLYGDPELERAVKSHIATNLGHNELFLMKMAANVHRIRIPLCWGGRIRTETIGDLHGQLDIKRGGIFTITEGVKVLALESKILEGGTLKRIAALVEAGVLNRVEAENLCAAFDQLISLRLRFQVESISGGQAPSNNIVPDRLNRMELGKLRLALEEVCSFQGFLKRRYQLGQFF